ncbi:lamin tail domain-containing protein [Streptomyces sp. SID4951]|nr:lamin tail domain-containing protein [Streptomyces sp. SID4951]
MTRPSGRSARGWPRPVGPHGDTCGRDDRSNRSLNAEWVTVRNTGRTPVNIKGWSLSDKSGHTYRFGNLRLAGHSQIRVHTGYGHDNRWDVYQDRRNYVWDNNRDTATLRNDHRRVVDQERWGHGHRH